MAFGNPCMSDEVRGAGSLTSEVKNCEPTPAHSPYRADIDGLRAIAVGMVVLYHFFPDTLPSGFVGVDVFFVLSGYLISGIVLDQLAAGRYSLLDFYSRRIRRIFPALLVVLVSCLLFAWFALLADEYKQLGHHVAAGAGFISNLVLWGESGYFDNAAETKPLLHLWSLGIEEQFYIVWPLLLAFAVKRRWPLLWVLLVLGLASLAWNIRELRVDVAAAYYSPLGRGWELLLGAATAVWARSGSWQARLVSGSSAVRASQVPLANGLAMAGVLLLGIGLVLINPQRAFPGAWALLPTVGTALLILAGQGGAWLSQRVLSLRPLVALGLISYPLYLWHWPLLVFPRLAEGGMPSTVHRVACIVLAGLLATATYWWVERPIRRSAIKGSAPSGMAPGIGNSSLSNKGLVGGLLGLMVVVGGAGFVIDKAEGLPKRSTIAMYANNLNELQRTPGQDQACKAYLGGGPVPFNYCRFTPAGELARNGADLKTIAVMGDSHAHVAYPGIAEHFAAKGINTLMVANSGCPPFLGAEYGSDAHAKQKCRNQIEAMVQSLVVRQDIQRVLVFARGTKYITGLGFGEAEKAEAREPYISRYAYFEGLQATINTLAKSGKKVVVVAENPELGFSPQTCMPRPFRVDTGRCTLDKTTVEARQHDYLQGLSQLTNATVVQTLAAFCPGSTCLVSDRGQLLYADDDHLSVAGSRFQMKNVLAAVVDAN
jgi:peptidoglycan/LPS O-acetylase OafA/YrhL